MPLPGQLNPSPRLLLGPGPSDAHPRVLAAMATPLLGHLDPQFLEIMNETQEMLRQRLPDQEPADLSRSRATGMAGMETCFVNLIEPGDKVVRLRRRASSASAWSTSPAAAARTSPCSNGPGATSSTWTRSARRCKQVRPKVLGIVHAETSTGRLAADRGDSASCATSSIRCCVVDAVTSLGCVPVRTGRVGDRRGLQLHAEGPELPAGPVAGVVQRRGRRGDQAPARRRCRAGIST